MDGTVRISQWTRSVFPADLPDFNWSRLDLAGTIPNEKRLIIRLAVGAALLIASLFLPEGKVLYGLCLILSVLVTGFDYLLAAVESVRSWKPFTTSVFISLALVFAVAVGDLVDAAAFMILYRIYTIFVGYITERTMHSIWEALGESPKYQTSCELPKWIGWIAPLGLLASLLVFILQLWVFEAAPMIAVRNALSVLVIANPYSLFASIGLTWLCALCGAYRFRILFRGAGAMRKLLKVRSVVLDDSGAEASELPKVISVKSDKVEPDMLLQLAAYAECHSESRTAKAILAAFHAPINEKLVERTLDIPRSGVEAYVSGLHLFVGTRELMLLHSITIPEEDLSDGYAVYVAVQGTYAGRLMLQEVANLETKDAMEELRELGVRTVTLFSPAQNESVTDIARELKAQLFCKLEPEEKERTIAKLQKAMPRTESLLYIEKDCEARPKRSAADVNACMIRGDNLERFDADFLVVDGDLHKIAEAIETTQWVNSLRRDHFAAAAVVKAALVLLAIFGCSTMWFAAVLDGAAALATMLLSVRAYGFEKQHRRLRDLLKPYETK